MKRHEFGGGGGGAGLIDHEVVSKATNPNYFFIGESLLNFVPEHGVFFLSSMISMMKRTRLAGLPMPTLRLFPINA